ncbi:MAG: formate/nitrite transporter family protein [Prevotellaceae bacterium]|nr:formate/nitrite transporter family protein [Prevotellaceae bacterium]
MKRLINVFLRAALAGVAISCGCVCFLSVGGVTGAVLFTFGLLTVVHYRFQLYTGTAGFVSSWREVAELLLILLGNIAGCLLVARGVAYARPELGDAAEALLTARLQRTLPGAFILAMGCGFIMTTAVAFARKDKFLPLLFGVPCFIMCGFLHSIADACYYLMSPCQFLASHWAAVLSLYLTIVLGNFVGCNLYRVGNVCA